MVPPLSVSPTLHLPDPSEDLLHHLGPAHAAADLHLYRVGLALLDPLHHVSKVLQYLNQT